MVAKIYLIVEFHVLTSCEIAHRRRANFWLFEMRGQSVSSVFRVAAYYQWLLLVLGREQMKLAHR